MIVYAKRGISSERRFASCHVKCQMELEKSFICFLSCRTGCVLGTELCTISLLTAISHSTTDIKQANIVVYSDLLIPHKHLALTLASTDRRYLYVLTSTNVCACASAVTLAPFVIHHLSTTTQRGAAQLSSARAARDHSRFRRQSMMLFTEC